MHIFAGFGAIGVPQEQHNLSFKYYFPMLEISLRKTIIYNNKKRGGRYILCCGSIPLLLLLLNDNSSIEFPFFLSTLNEIKNLSDCVCVCVSV